MELRDLLEYLGQGSMVALSFDDTNEIELIKVREALSKYNDPNLKIELVTLYRADDGQQYIRINVEKQE